MFSLLSINFRIGCVSYLLDSVIFSHFLFVLVGVVFVVACKTYEFDLMFASL